MARIIIDELINLVSIKLSKDSKKTLESFNNGLKSIRNIALVATGALSGMAYAMDKLVSGVDKQARFAEGIGVSYENLQRLQYAASKARISTDELDSALNTIVQTMSSTKPGEYNGALLQLGISARNLDGSLKDPVQLLLEIGDALKRLSAIRRQQFGGSRFGFGNQFTNFLGQGSDKIRRDMEEAEAIGAVIPEGLKGIASGYYDQSLLQLKTTLKGIATVISLSLAPAISDMLDDFNDWIIKNKELLGLRIGETLKGVGQGLSNFGSIVMVAARAISALLNNLIGTNKELTTESTVSFVVAAALTALAAAYVAANAPLVALTAAVGLAVYKFSALLALAHTLEQIFKIMFPRAFEAASISIDKATNSLERFKNLLKDVNPFTGYGSISDINSKAKGILEQVQLTQQYGNSNGLLEKLYNKTGGDTSQITKAINNVTINVNGAGDPLVVANTVKQKIDLATAVQVANPGFNRPAVT